MKNFTRHLPYAIVTLIIAAILVNPRSDAGSDGSKAVRLVTDDEGSQSGAQLESYRPQETQTSSVDNEISKLKSRVDKLEREFNSLTPAKSTAPSNGSSGGSSSVSTQRYYAPEPVQVVVSEPMVQVCSEEECIRVPQSQAYRYSSRQNYQSSQRAFRPLRNAFFR